MILPPNHEKLSFVIR